MTVSKHIPVLAGGLALAIALFLAPGAAQAANECGPLNSSNSFTANCPNAAYTSGIVYGERTHAVTLTVPGTATTATVTAAGNTGWHNGISVSTNAHATETRNIALTVGGTGTFVAIVQGSSPPANLWYRNTGIVVRQSTSNGSTTTVDVKSGVTIGSETTKMMNRGIYVRAHSSATAAGAVSVTSAATVYSQEQAIYVVNSSAAATTTVTNSGALTSDTRGIHVLDDGSAGAVTVMNSGAITSESTGGTRASSSARSTRTPPVPTPASPSPIRPGPSRWRRAARASRRMWARPGGRPR